MKKLILLLAIIIPMTVSCQGYWGSLQKFLAGIQLGDSITGSDIWTIDSITFKTTYFIIYTNGVGYAFANHDALNGFVADEHVDHSSVTFLGLQSLSGGGDMATSKNFTFDNDETTPGTNEYYGTNGLGAKGWNGLMAALERLIPGISEIDSIVEGNGIMRFHYPDRYYDVYAPVSSGDTTNYYFSMIGGDDSNDGHSIDNPKQTIIELNSLTLDPGDSVFFNKGDRWDTKADEQLVPPSSGSAGSPIVFTSYGIGVKPMLSRSTNESETSDWFDNGGNLWSNDDASFDEDVGNLIFNDDSAGYKRELEAHVDDTIGEFWYDYAGDSIVTYCPLNPAIYYGNIECAISPDVIRVGNGASYITFDGLNIKYSGGYGLIYYDVNASNIIVRNCNFEWIGGEERSDGQGYRRGNGIEFINASFENILIEKNYFREIFDAAVVY